MNRKGISSLFVGLSVFLFFVGCDNTLTTSVNDESLSPNFSGSSFVSDSGTLKVSFAEKVTRTILPSIDMVVASYDLSGIGPDDACFSESAKTGEILIVENLVNGDWFVSVTAKNSNGDVIGFGETAVKIFSNDSVSVNISVNPFEGSGNLMLDVNWPADKIYQAEIESSLSPVDGSTENLDFVIGEGQASCQKLDVESGYYTLVLKLLDNGIVTAGTVEIVRIVAKETTEGIITFDNINRAKGEITVNIEQKMENPLDVEITGGSETKLLDETQKLTATVTNYVDNVIFVWYVNGSLVETGSTFKFDKTWETGYYNIDVIAYTTDGTRAGSASHSVEVLDDPQINESNFNFNVVYIIQ